MHVDTHGMQAMQTMSTRIDPRGALVLSYELGVIRVIVRMGTFVCKLETIA